MPLCEDCGNYFEGRGKELHGLHLCPTCYEMRSKHYAKVLRDTQPSAQSLLKKLHVIASTIDGSRYERYKKCLAELEHTRFLGEIDKALQHLYRLSGYKIEVLKEIRRIGASLKATLVGKKVDE